MNLNITGLFTGKLFKGSFKQFCVPGLNCYSCPSAVGSCPIGALQSVANTNGRISLFVLGTLALFGLLLGRFICGFICPFGFFQDLLYKIKTKKYNPSLKKDGIFRYAKYLVLIIAVLLIPLLYRTHFGQGIPFFCQFLCPAGVLQGGFPLIITTPSVVNSLGALFNWKLLILLVFALTSVLSYRTFCKYICPLGAFYALFNKIALYKYTFKEENCTMCKKCETACPMGISPYTDVNHMECIRCGRCVKACEFGAIGRPFVNKVKNGKPHR